MAEGKVDSGMDPQKASVWKRMAAWILDAILTAVLAVDFGVLLSAMLGFDGYYDSLQGAYDKYEAQYGVEFQVTVEDYEALRAEQKAKYDTAYEALINDAQVIRDYNMVVNLSLIITSIGILLAILALEFVVPLLLKNGQTVGKKAFGIGLVTADCIKVSTLQLFVRALLGKYTIETMIPVYILLMFLWGTMDMTGTVVLGALLIVQLLCIGISRNNTAIHDKLAGTVVIDLPSQKIFDSPEALIEYTKRIAAERARRENY